MNTNYKAIALKTKMTTLVLSLFTALICTAQVQQNGTLYIGDSGVVSVHSGNFSFGTTPAATQTTKTASTFGRLFFVGTTTYGDATNAHHINGYAATTGKTAFVFPVGSGIVYAPLQITAATAADTYNAAYYPNNPTTIGATFDAVTLSALATTEYWDVQSTSNAKVTLTWRSTSNLSTLASNTTIDNLTIAGWNGTQWDIIASNFDTNGLVTSTPSTVAEGSITSTDNVNFATFSKFAIAYKNTILSNPDFNTTKAIALIKNQFFSVTANENITGIQLYDIAGRLIMDHKNIKESAFNSPFNHAAGVYIAKIRLDSGKTVTQKLINN